MFRPHIGSCNNCPRTETWIVVKVGLCQYCNHEKKQKGKRCNNTEENSDRVQSGVVEYERNGSIKDYPLQRRWTSRKMDKETKSPNVKARKPLFKPKKGTGEAEVFAEIAEEREWICFVSSQGLLELTATQFMHVLPKALNKYPLFKLYKPNIQLATNEVHYLWDHTPRSELKKDRRFDKLFALEEQLKQEYKLLKQKP